jgi:hypothetical protein
VHVCRIFNQNDEITCIPDLVQGDILFVQAAGGDEESPGREVEKVRNPVFLNWARMMRMINLQCVKGFVISEVMRTSKLCETFKARRLEDDAQVVIKRMLPTPGVRMSTFKSYVLQVR